MIRGMDTERVDALATTMSAIADRVRAMETRLSQGLGTTDWVGSDRDRFDASWHAQHRQALRDAATALDEAAALATSNVREQDGASA